ncbi:MAG: NADH-quinone oxidoreductase subunit L [Planctomycetota bacterium]|nr:MAG: NADH-quinone oxidoreductase subunit L [Planctomycetota bacterium]
MSDPTTMLLAASAGAPDSSVAWLLQVPLLPLLACLLCGLFRAWGVTSKLPGYTTVLLLAVAFVVTLSGYLSFGGHGAQVVHGFDWLRVSWGDGPGETLSAGFSLYIDSLTWLWMLFVTGLATLIALYSTEYMAEDQKTGGYARYFSFFSLFVFMMSCLVMSDNLLLLYLGWEGVGLCSYLLIGYHYTKPSAVAAAKKAFIVNRVGDLGLALGLMLTFVHFGTLEYREIFARLAEIQAVVEAGGSAPWQVELIPLLLMVGAFGKSAQLPLYVWLPDAMEGPTPVSALIHAATMVTAGVYLVARFLPMFALSPAALGTVAWVGAGTALLAATIGMAQYDIKRVMAYSTVSQLGYMFLGLGVLTATGAAYHVFTHAFFKATLFLACGAVMHGFAGQLDLRRLSGLAKVPGWRVTAVAMLVGCLCLAGFVGTSGFFSKDMILAEAFVTPGPGYRLLGWIGLATAGLTAYYAFRVYFRVFHGPVEFHAGEEHHGDDGHDDHGHGFHPHAPGWAINLVLIALVIGSLAAAAPYFIDKEHHGWVGGLVHSSTAGEIVRASAGHGEAAAHAGEAAAAEHGGFFGDPHRWMFLASSVVGAIGILLAWVIHMTGRVSADRAPIADALKARLRPWSTLAEKKWLVDELYDALIRRPLRLLAHILALIDQALVDGLVDGVGFAPRLFGKSLRPSQNGLLQNYAVGMGGGLVFILLVVWALS